MLQHHQFIKTPVLCEYSRFNDLMHSINLNLNKLKCKTSRIIFFLYYLIFAKMYASVLFLHYIHLIFSKKIN